MTSLSWSTLALLSTAQAQEGWTTTHDQWFANEIEGRHIGWTHVLVEERADQVRTTEEERWVYLRGGETLVEEHARVYLESGGEMLSMESLDDMAGSALHHEWTWQADGILHSVSAGERVQEQLLPLPPCEGPLACLTPSQQARLLADPSQEHLVWTRYEAQLGLFLDEQTLERQGPHQWRLEVPTMGLEMIMEVDEAGQLDRGSYETAGFGSVLRPASREEATSTAAIQGADLDPLVSMHLDAAVPGAVLARKARLRVRLPDAPLPLLPSTGMQRIKPRGEHEALVLLDIERPAMATAEEQADPRYLAATPYVDAEDPVIQEMARQVAGRTQSPRSQANLLVGYLRQHFTPAATGQATASQVARSLEGDCTEVSILLVALLRSLGIPARVASGYVYVDEHMGASPQFAMHSWTQALMDGRWVDLDAALPQPIHPVRLAVFTSPMEDLWLADGSVVYDLVGKLEIEVLSVKQR